MITIKADMKLCLIKSFKTDILQNNPKTFISSYALNFGRYIKEKYQIRVIGNFQRSHLTLRHGTNSFFLNRFIRLLQQDRFINQIRLFSIGLYLTTILNLRQFFSEDHRSNLRKISINSLAREWQLGRIPAYSLRNIHMSPAVFNLPNYSDILHPDFRSQSQPTLQMWLKQVRSISGLIQRRLSDWKTSIESFIVNRLSASRELLIESHRRLDAFAGIGSASLDFGRPNSGRLHIKTTPLLFQLMHGQSPKHDGFLNRALQNFNRQLFSRWSKDIDSLSVIRSPDGDLVRLLPLVARVPSMSVTAPPDKMLRKIHLMRRCRYLSAQTDSLATTTNEKQYHPNEEIEEKILNHHLFTLSHLTIRPFRLWPNLLLETDEHETLRSLCQFDEKNLKAKAAFIDKRTRHLTDRYSSKNVLFSTHRPPKMKLVVSENKTFPDLRGELQSIERRLKNIKPTESSPPPNQIDIHQVSERVYSEIERKLRIERERRGL